MQITCNTGAISIAYSFRNHVGILSGPADLPVRFSQFLVPGSEFNVGHTRVSSARSCMIGGIRVHTVLPSPHAMNIAVASHINRNVTCMENHIKHAVVVTSYSAIPLFRRNSVFRVLLTITFRWHL